MQSDFTFLDRLRLRETPPERIDAVDPRLVLLGDLADRDEWTEAGERAFELISERVYDVRPLTYYFFARFHEIGLPSLANVLGAVGSIMDERFDAVGPSKRREHHFDKRLTWMFDKMLKTLEYHEHKRTPEWADWHVGMGPGALDPAIAAAESLTKALADKTAFEESPRALTGLLAWLRGHAEQLALPPPRKKTQQPPPPSAPAVSPVIASLAEDDDEDEDEVIASLQRRVELLVSHEFRILVAKLKVFEILVGKKDLTKAAIVADDLNRLIAAFDPRAYFPELFARYTALYSEHVVTLTDQIEQRESPTWKALEQFYRVDSKAFVEGK